MRKKAAPHNNRIHFVLFVCVLCTMWCSLWFLHEMVLLLHENLNYCTKRIWDLCKLQNKNFSMVCCATLWWDGAGKGRGWKTAAIIYCWQQQHVRGRTAQLWDISSGATCVADLDSRALALTKEASGNSRAPLTPPPPPKKKKKKKKKKLTPTPTHPCRRILQAYDVLHFAYILDHAVSCASAASSSRSLHLITSQLRTK